MTRYHWWILVLLAALTAGPTWAQEAGSQALNVYVDCQTYGCDSDYFRTEIYWVNWVRDRQVADVHVLVTAQQTGAGGRQFDLNFIGRGGFSGLADTMAVSTQPTATTDDTRRALVNRLQIGLLRYVAETPIAERVEIRVPTEEDAPEQASSRADDPWNFWVFRLSMNGYMNGESRTSMDRLSGSLSASRTTAEWKFDLGASSTYQESSFELSSGAVIRTIRRSQTADMLVVNSWGDHWSGGITASVGSSTQSNEDLSAYGALALEYNLFPYAQSTRRQLTALYSIGPRYFDYDVETLYGRTSDNVVEHSLELDYATNQPWGSINIGTSASQYLGWEPGADVPAELSVDEPRYSLGLNGGVNVRLVRGLSFNVNAFYSRVRNQIGLPRGEASDEDVLLEIRELETLYSYYARIGLSYTFGSIYNNVVNPRFERGSDERRMMLF